MNGRVIPPTHPADPWITREQNRKLRSAGSLVDARALPLRKWLKVAFGSIEPLAITRNQFPTRDHKKEFIDNIHQFSDLTIRILLQNFLVPTGTNWFDLQHLQIRTTHPTLQLGNAKAKAFDIYGSRLLRHRISKGHYPVWEGIHWIIALLPHFPQIALDAIDAFSIAMWQYLTDAYLNGLDDAATIIRHRYIISVNTRAKAQDVLASLASRDFEFAAAVALEADHFQTDVTRQSKDGGIDIWVAKPPLIRRAAVQCKQTDIVGVQVCRETLYCAERANQAIVVALGRFSRDARRLEQNDKRLRLIDGHELIELLNRGHGPDWVYQIDSIISAFKAREREKIEI